MLKLVSCFDTPVESCSCRHDIAVDACVFEQMLLQFYPTLLLIEFIDSLASTEFYVEVRDLFVEDTTFESLFYFPVPHVLWIEMQIVLKPASDDNSASKFLS